MTHKSVGFGRPPVEHRFKPGQSGNPGGRPKKQKSFNAFAILDEPITVKRDGIECEMSPFQAQIQSMLIKAFKHNDLRALLYLIKQFDKYDLLAPPPQSGGSVLTLPSSMPWPMAVDMTIRFGSPPWSKKQLEIGAADYKAKRSNEQRLIDDEIGYPDL